MEFKIPTRDECKNLVENSEAFYMAERFIEGQKVEIYDYRLASISDFFPEDGSNWTELRGLCFVNDFEYDTWETNILMNKFFNVGQTIGWMYEDIKNKKIIELANKEDGSIISFVKFKNGKIRAKSKTSFESDQARMAQEVFDNNVYMQKEVNRMLDDGETPIFELVGPENQIVLEYQNTELILLQIRDYDGHYFGKKTLIEKASIMNVNVAESFPESMMNLDDLLTRKEIDQSDIEGWVVTFEDGQMAKIKTDKYLSLHGLIGPDAFRENLLIKTILDGNIDDVISALVPGEKKDKIVTLTEKVEHKFNHLVVEFKKLRGSYYNEFYENRKDFALKHSKNPLFSYVMKSLNTPFRDVEKTAEESVKTYIEKKCNSLSNAKEWVEELKDEKAY